MRISRLPKAGGSPPSFLVERYLSSAGADGLAASVAEVARICAEQGSEAGNAAVRYLHSIYLPAEDICFCVFEAASSDVVRAVNEAGHFPLDRIAEAVLLNTRTRSRPPTTPRSHS